MKKILVLLLLVLMIVWSGGILQVTCLRIVARLKAANILAFESPEIWQFDEHDLLHAEWVEEDEEFILKGRMFDVLYVETRGETSAADTSRFGTLRLHSGQDAQRPAKIYHCYFDHFETKVVAGADLNDDALLNHPVPHHKNVRDNVSLMSVDLFFECPEIFHCRTNVGTRKTFSLYQKSSKYMVFQDAPAVPPEFVCI